MVITFLDALYCSKFSDNQKEEIEEEQKGSSHFRLCRYMLGAVRAHFLLVVDMAERILPGLAGAPMTLDYCM